MSQVKPDIASDDHPSTLLFRIVANQQKQEDCGEEILRLEIENEALFARLAPLVEDGATRRVLIEHGYRPLRVAELHKRDGRVELIVLQVERPYDLEWPQAEEPATLPLAPADAGAVAAEVDAQAV